MKENSSFGLVHGTLYKANPSSLSFTKYAHIDTQHPYNQAYGHYLMITVHDEEPTDWEGKHFMVDTYLIDKTKYYAQNMDNRIANIAKIDYMTKYQLSNLSWACYYRSMCEVTENTASLFTPLCALSEMRQLKANERGFYAPEDCIYNAHLARELGFHWDYGDIGINLVKKTAKVLPHLKAEELKKQLFENYGTLHILPHEISTWRIKEFERYVFEHRDNPAVLDVYETVRPRIEETLAFNEAHATHEAYGQMSLFNVDELD